jgi:hypothetical protein
VRISRNVFVTPGDVTEHRPLLDSRWPTRFRGKLRPHQATGDTTYATSETIVALQQAGIRVYLPLPDFDQRSPFFGKGAFSDDAERDVSTRPQGETPRFRRNRSTENARGYQADATVCNACPLKAKCPPRSQGRQIKRLVDEAYLDRVRAYHTTAPCQKAIRKRSVWVEPRFAEAKQWHGLRRFRLRRLRKVSGEALLTATGQNLMRLQADDLGQIGRWEQRSGGARRVGMGQVVTQIPPAQQWEDGRIGRGDDDPNGHGWTIAAEGELGSPPDVLVPIAKRPLDSGQLSGLLGTGPCQLFGGLLGRMDSVDRGPGPFRGVRAHHERQARYAAGTLGGRVCATQESRHDRVKRNVGRQRRVDEFEGDLALDVKRGVGFSLGQARGRGVGCDVKRVVDLFIGPQTTHRGDPVVRLAN